MNILIVFTLGTLAGMLLDSLHDFVNEVKEGKHPGGFINFWRHTLEWLTALTKENITSWAGTAAGSFGVLMPLIEKSNFSLWIVFLLAIGIEVVGANTTETMVDLVAKDLESKD